MLGLRKAQAALLRTGSNLLGIGLAALVVVEADPPEPTHLRPEGVSALGTSDQHAGSISGRAGPVMARKV